MAAINKYTTSPEFTAKHRAWLESVSPDTLVMTPVAKADLEKMRAEEASVKQGVPKKWTAI